MALVKTTTEQVLKRIRTTEVRGEMQLLFEIAEEKKKLPWYYEDSWDLKSFGHVRGKRQIVFKTSYAGVERIINAHATTTWVKHSVKRVLTGDFKGEPKLRRASEGGKPHIFLMIGEQAVKFQGTKATGATKGSSVNAATKTKMQEIGSAYVFYLALCKGKKWKTWMELHADPQAKPCLKKIWEGHGGDWEEDGEEWAINFFIQQKALLAKLACGGNCCLFSEFVHSDEAMQYLPGPKRDKSFMKYITEIVGKIGISQKDNWNPADIWLIRTGAYDEAVKNIDAIMEAALDDEGKLQQLNHYMRVLFNKKKVFGISLKKVTKDPATVVYFNNTIKFFNKNWGGEGYGGKGTDNTRMHYLESICKLGIETKEKGTHSLTTLETQDAWFIVKDSHSGGGTYKFQIKANNSSEFSGMKYEATAVGHGDARLGKATVELVVKAINDASSLTFTKEKESYAKTCQQFYDNKGAPGGKGWQEIIHWLYTNRTRLKLDLGNVSSKEECYTNMCLAFNESGQAHVANAKLQELRWLYCFYNINGEDAKNAFATNMVWLSMKAGRRYGPFAKIY